MALLLALGGCQDADEASALNGCLIARLEKAPNSSEYEYLAPCMALKGYKYRSGDKRCLGLVSSFPYCYEPDGDLARIRKNIFGK